MATQLAEPSLSADKALSAFLSHLEGERRLSPRTVEAYDRDLSGLFEFLTGHLGGRLTLKALSHLSSADWRAWLADRVQGKPVAHADVFVDAAWRAISATPCE